jgi:chemosensory pili system protein ChpA (sensor histidine kinase/response regulator)
MIPVIDLNAIFGITRKSPKIRFALVTHCAGRPVALLVEEVLSQEETILRSFGSFLKNLPHISGTSISGDGTLRLVLNPNRILPDTPATQPREGLESVPVESKLRILVVDDSLSVRKHAGFILENNGIDVITANNGIEALDAIDQGQFDFIITDLEMPLMHGYELLGELQRRRLLEETPAAVLSSRASQVHQDKARDLGACDYLVKPFDEESLMALVRKHLNAIG